MAQIACRSCPCCLVVADTGACNYHPLQRWLLFGTGDPPARPPLLRLQAPRVNLLLKKGEYHWCGEGHGIIWGHIQHRGVFMLNVGGFHRMGSFDTLFCRYPRTSCLHQECLDLVAMRALGFVGLPYEDEVLRGDAVAQCLSSRFRVQALASSLWISGF